MFSKPRNDPSESEAAARSRALQDGQQLNPPARWPALFTCRYMGEKAVGCVFRNGCVCVMPDRCERFGPGVWNNLRAVEESDQITHVVWEWDVSRAFG